MAHKNIFLHKLTKVLQNLKSTLTTQNHKNIYVIQYNTHITMRTNFVVADVLIGRRRAVGEGDFPLFYAPLSFALNFPRWTYTYTNLYISFVFLETSNYSFSENFLNSFDCSTFFCNLKFLKVGYTLQQL